MAQPNKTTYQIVSILAGEQKITLFSAAGEVVDIPHNEDYDTGAIMAYLKGKITGMNAVDLDISGYLSKKATEINKVLADGGIETTQVIDGKEVQGIFYPKKMKTQVKIAGENVAVPGIDNLIRHAKRANEHNPQAVKNFLERMAPVMKTRAHSVEDLMNFIGHSEMPLTNDGRIICYKRVKRSTEAGIYLDAASSTIKQRVGSRVFMDVEKVDPSRYNSCSNGLHVANQIYMKEFSGDVTMLVLISPEDFIAVPKHENGKARVCAYDVIGILDTSAHEELSKGYVKNNDGLKHIIAQAIEGTHVQPFENVHAGQKTLIKITPIEGRRVVTTSKAPVSAKTLKNTRSLDEDGPNAGDQKDEDTVNVKTVINTMAKKAIKLPDEVLKAFQLIRDGQSKGAVGRTVGTSDRSVGRWMDKYDYDTWLENQEEALLKAVLASQEQDDLDAVRKSADPDESEEVSQEDLEATAEMASIIITNLAADQPTATKPSTKAEQARKLFEAGLIPALVQLKKASKKSWKEFGFTPFEIGQITKAMG